MARSRSGTATVPAARTRRAPSAERTFCAGVATRLAQGVAPITQLWPAPSQLQAPPTPGAAALEAQAGRDGALPRGHAASIERTPQAAVPLLRVGDGDRASTHRNPGTPKYHGGAARCGAPGTHPLNRQPGCTTGHQHAPRVWWQGSFKKPPSAPSRPCNEGGRGNKRRLRQPICDTPPSAPAKLVRDVSCVGDRHGNPGSSNRVGGGF